MKEMLIKNGNVVFEEDTYPADILVRDGKIAAFYKPGEAPEAVQDVLDAEGLYIMQGSIDPHTHWGIYKDYTTDVVVVSSHRYGTLFSFPSSSELGRVGLK